VIRMLVTDGSGRSDLALEGADVDFIQVREPGLNIPELARKVRKLIHADGPRILVNDRSDVAIACGAAGVHLRDSSVSPKTIRRIAPPGFVITVACHDAEGVFRAADEGADYAVLAPVFAPLSKPPSRAPLGLEALRAIASRTKLPVIALGGITNENAALCIEAGATGVAGISMFQMSRAKLDL
jgi:thiamine-phosphate diphosphorylase